LSIFAVPVALGARRWLTAPRASFQTSRRTSSSASVAHETTWNGSAHSTASGQRLRTTRPIHSAESADTWVIWAHRSSPSASKNPASAFVAAGGGPHQPAGVVVDHDHQVLVPALVGDLIDPDPLEPLEPVDAGVDVGHDPGDDVAHRAPPDP
jgi:hypothetical protein